MYPHTRAQTQHTNTFKQAHRNTDPSCHKFKVSTFAGPRKDSTLTNDHTPTDTLVQIGSRRLTAKLHLDG